MPFITEEEACELKGLSPAACAEQAAQYAARHEQAKAWCADYMSNFPESVASCEMVCGVLDRGDMHECVQSMIAIARRDREAQQQQTNLYIALAVIAAFFMAMGWFAWRKYRKAKA